MRSSFIERAKDIRLWMLAVGLLLLANLGWMICNWKRNGELRAGAEQFKFGKFRTNDVEGIGIEETKTGRPLWIEWDFDHRGKADVISYYFHGTNVLNLHLKEGQPPRYDVIFHGPGRSEVWWWDRGSGSFTERISYDTNGNRCGFEVWYDGAWRPVDRLNKKNGIVINGQWFHLKLNTNGAWTIEDATK
jgi:hypothetical protein